MKKIGQFVIFSIFLASCSSKLTFTTIPVSSEPGPIQYEKESHLKNIHQLTYGGNNAEAYWSPNGKELIFQSDNGKWGVGCDQR